MEPEMIKLSFLGFGLHKYIIPPALFSTKKASFMYKRLIINYYLFIYLLT